MSPRFVFLICLFFLTADTSAQRQDFTFHKLDIYKGMSSNQVKAIIKDKNGFIWFGTMSGLERYDGYTFRLFRNTLNNNTVTTNANSSIDGLYELPGDKIWVKSINSESGIFNFRAEKFEMTANSYLQLLGMPMGRISNVVKGNAGRYWFVYEDKGLGLYLYSSTDGKVQKIEGENTKEKADDVKETNDGQVWIVYHDGLIQKYSIAQRKLLFASDVILKQNVNSYDYNFIVDSDGDLWLRVLSKGVYLFAPKSNTVRQFTENSPGSKLSSNLITQILQDNNGLIWVATDHGGVTLINKKENCKTDYLLNDPLTHLSLSQNSIISMYQDNRGVIWLGTYKNGVNYFIDNSIVKLQLFHHKISDPNSIQYDDINCFVEDKSGNTWIGTNGGGLIYFDRKKNSFKQVFYNADNKTGVKSNVIVSLYIDHEGILWIGTFFEGLYRYDGKKFTYYKHIDGDSTSLSDNNVWALCEDAQQNLWVGTLNEGLNILNKKTGKLTRYVPDKKISPGEIKYISVLKLNNDGNIWVGTSASGVFTIDKNQKIIHQYSNNTTKGVTNDGVLSLNEDSQGRLLIGTKDGLTVIDEKTNKSGHFTVFDGLPDNAVLNVLEDKNHTFWISTPRGLCNAILNIKGNDLKLSVIHYTEINGLQNLEFNEKAAMKTRSGELFFGGPSGFNIINPDNVIKSAHPEKIIFTGLQILDKFIYPGDTINGRVVLPQSLPFLDEIHLKYKENVFTIEFSTTGLMADNNERYAYILEGFNNDWLYPADNKHSATYTNLSPGNYVFKVKAMGSNGVWGDIKTIKIEVQPPLWRTTAAYLLYFILLSGLLLLIRKITLDRVHMRYQMAQFKYEADRANEMEQIKTKFFTNVSHEFRTPLSLIITPLDKLVENETEPEQRQQLKLVHRNARRLLNLVNQLLDFRKMEVQEVKLYPSVGDIVSFCKDIADSFTDIAERKKIEFTFSSNIDELGIYFDKDKMEKILFNLISNAYKYTLDNGKVSMKLIYNQRKDNQTEDTLTIEVADSGIGIPVDKHEMIFERFFQTEAPANIMNQGMGLGLAITKEFVKLHGGVITVKSEVNKGTCFTVLLPARKIYNEADNLSLIPGAAGEMETPVSNKKPSVARKRILLVEDNEDIRFYLKDNLSKIYHVEEAVNGKEGWDKAKSMNPDLIVSDIMMPVMDGLELSGKIRNDLQTAHIPIILLTAMGSEEMQIEGYKIGVNDYIKKPFIFDILASRIKNLITQQIFLQKKFHKQIEVNPSEVTVTSIDEKFLKDALEVVEKHIDDAEFSVEDFSREIFMNRVTLYRKIQALTGKTPSEFIRSIRLKRAAQLLGKSGQSVSEIAWEVGYNDPKKFAKQFKEEFGITPSQYASNSKNNV